MLLPDFKGDENKKVFGAYLVIWCIGVKEMSRCEK